MTTIKSCKGKRSSTSQKDADMINAQNKVSENQQTDTESRRIAKKSSGIQIAMRPKVAVNMMRCQFPSEVTTEINTHIDDVIIPNNVDHSKGLVDRLDRMKGHHN